MFRNNLIEKIREEKLIAIIRNISRENIVKTAEAVIDGGIHLLEIAFDASHVVPDEQVAKNISELVETFGGDAYFGAGTVLSDMQVKLVQQAGGSFVISPNVDKNVIRATRKENLVSIPGAFSPTEIINANKFGADFVKVFPASALGVQYIRAIKAPISNVELLAVGGVTEKDIEDYMSAGIAGFGIGANIVDRKVVDTGDFTLIKHRAQSYVEAVKKAEGK